MNVPPSPLVFAQEIWSPTGVVLSLGALYQERKNKALVDKMLVRYSGVTDRALACSQCRGTGEGSVSILQETDPFVKAYLRESPATNGTVLCPPPKPESKGQEDEEKDKAGEEERRHQQGNSHQ